MLHALEYVSGAAKAYFGDNAAAVETATTRGRELLLGDGYAGVVAWAGELGVSTRMGVTAPRWAEC